MGHTHGFSPDDEYRICTCCGEKLPQTKEYFVWSKANKNYEAICRKCKSKKAKERRKLKEQMPTINRPVYDYTKECIYCHRELPFDWMHFPVDKTTVTGLRNRCRECNSNYGKFLTEDSKVTINWTEKEDAIIRENYANYSGIELHELFLPNRTVRAIESRASTLHVIGKTEEARKRSYKVAGEKTSEKLKGKIVPEESKRKMSEAKKEYFKTHDSWAKGIKFSEEHCNHISEAKKKSKAWQGDSNPRHKDPLNGKRNGRWKGGINKTYVELRSDTRDWQQKSMNFCNYKCVVTGGEFHNIHHTKSFRDIVDDVFVNTGISVKEKVLDYSEEEFESLRDNLKLLHDNYGYGACINKDVHKLFHDTYGYTGFTQIDFVEFMEDISDGKYNTWFSEHDYEININSEYLGYLKEICCLEKQAA